jgi:hypothetical protein
MDTFKALKWVTATVCAFGADSVVNGVIKNNVIATSTLEKVLLTAGRIGIGSLVGVAVGRHIEAEFDDLRATFIEAKNEAEKELNKK